MAFSCENRLNLGAHAARVRGLWRNLFPRKKSAPQAPHAGRVRPQGPSTSRLKIDGRPIIASRLKFRHEISGLKRLGAAHDLNDLARDLGLAYAIHDQR